MSETAATGTDPSRRGETRPTAARPASPAPARRRRGLSLGARIVAFTSLLIALAVGVAVVATVLVADGIARRAAGEALAASASLQESFRARGDEQLYLISSLFANDPFIAAYLAESVEDVDRASILDLLAERQADLGFDLAMVLDPQGRVVARTDRPADGGADLSAEPLVARAIAELGASGIWWEGGGLYQAAVVPLARGGQLVAYLLTGLALDDASALEVKRMTSTEVVYLAPGEDGVTVHAATLDPSMEGMFLAGLTAPGGPMAGEGTSGRDLDVEIDGQPWIARLTPLSAGPATAGASAVSLAPLAPRLAPFRRIVEVLALSGAGALLLGVVLTFAFARRTMAPVRDLVRATGAARAGDYEHRPVATRDDEIGQLAHAFDDLLAELREKREMEDYLANITRSLPDAMPVAAPTEAAMSAPAMAAATVMLIEWRRHARSGGDPAAAVGRLGEDLRQLAEAAARRGGSLDGVAGHRAWLRFEGADRSARAFLTAATLMRAWADGGAGEADAPVVAVAAGETVRGSVESGGRPRPALLGRAVQELESLAREAVPGELVLSDRVADELAPTLAGFGCRPRRQPGVLGRGGLWVVEAAEAAALDVAAADVAAPTLPSAAAGAAERRAPRPRPFGGIGPGSVVGGRFEIVSVLGAGGMGTVFKARDRELDEVVALKILKPELAGDAANVERMREELRLARRITHPNVLRTFDLGTVDLGDVDGVPYITMEYVQGVTLARLLEHAGRLSLAGGLRVARQLCHGLAAAHAEGVIHRDIKPPNLLLQPNGNVKLMDFGIARRQRRVDPGLTSVGWVMGTPLYLAPEQLRGEEPDGRTDLYACGVVFYEMFTGAPPFAGASYADLAAKTMREEPPPPSAAWPEIPPPLEAVILRCLAKERTARPADAGELLAELETIRG